MKTKIPLSVLLITIAVILPSLLHAQPSFTDDVVDAPIDGGLSLLIAGGIGYGVKKVGEHNKKNSEK